MRLLTPPGRAGVAVLAVAAAEAPAVRACLEPAAAPAQPVAGAPLPLRRCRLRLGGGLADDALLLELGGGAFELHVHGAPAVLDALRAAFGPFAEPAPSPAERLLQRARSVPQLQLALEQREFDFAAHLAALAALPPAARARELAALRRRSRAALALAQPQRLLLVGRQNAGKSTLLNRLLGRERALAGPTPGLTRDAIAEPLTLQDYPYELIDTAGAGDAGSELDAAAMRQAEALRQDALLLLLVDGSRGVGDFERRQLGPHTLVVATKADLPAAPWPLSVPCHLRCSCLDPAAAAGLPARLGELLRRWRRLPPAGPAGGPAALCLEQWQRLPPG